MVDAPEILTVIGKVPHLSEFLNSLYECQYKSFFVAFGKYVFNNSVFLFYFLFEMFLSYSLKGWTKLIGVTMCAFGLEFV